MCLTRGYSRDSSHCEVKVGSFDTTCILSDIGIRYGDKIACLLLQEGNYGEFDGVWNPISPFLIGKYDDYGQIKLDEEPTAFLEHLKPWVMPQVAGENSCHAQAVSPEHLDWNLLEDSDHEDRFFLYADDDSVPMFREQRKEKDRLLEWGDNMRNPGRKYSRGPFWDIQDALNDAGIKSTESYTDGACYLHADGNTGLFVIEPKFGTKINDPILDKIRGVLAPLGYSAYPIPINSSYSEDFPKADRGVRLLVAPSPHEDKYLRFGHYEKPKRIRATRGFIRMDVLDALFPVTERTVYRAGLLRDKRAEFLANKYESKTFMSGYRFAQALKQMGPKNYSDPFGLWYTSEGSTADNDHIAPQILAMPDDSPVEAFIPWLRLAYMIVGMKYPYRRGLRPTLKYVGSQCASEDWGDQLKYHRSMVDILDPIVVADKAERAKWDEE